MQYARKQYMDQLIRKKDNGRIKVITGLRRSGKSYLLFTLYRQYLRISRIVRHHLSRHDAPLSSDKPWLLIGKNGAPLESSFSLGRGLKRPFLGLKLLSLTLDRNRVA